MIYTISLSPSLDRTIDVDEFIYDDMNRILEEKRYAGGRGIDVSRVVKELGGESIALGFVGGYNGLEVEGRLINEGIICDFTRINGETRTNIIVHQRKKRLQTLLSAPGPEVYPIEVTTLHNKIKDIQRGSYVVLCGGMPPGINESFFAQITTSLKDRDVKVILDADGEALKRGVKAMPFLIKPNIHEFGRLVEKNVKEMEEILESAAPYLDVVEHIVVSAGVRGVIGISRDERYHVVPPKVNVKSSVGAGDSLVGGIVYAFSEGATFREALALGVACGTASTLNQGVALCSRSDAYEILKEVITKNL